MPHNWLVNWLKWRQFMSTIPQRCGTVLLIC
jgi:hypothetical protein